VQGRAALELERREARRDLVEAAAVLVERRQGLVGLGEDDRDLLEDVLGAVDVEADHVAALGDCDHERVRLLGHALGGAVPHPGLLGEDRRIRRQLDVRPHDPRCTAIQHNGAVHLRDLVQERRRVVDVEADPAREQERQVVRLPDHDQSARPGLNDLVDTLAQGRSGGDHLQRLDQSGLLPRFGVFPGSRRHR
jgi:hypothetical protein